MLADTKRELATALGVLHKEDGVRSARRSSIDPEGTIRFVSVTTSRSAGTWTRCCASSTRCGRRTRAMSLQLDEGRAHLAVA
jgi:alkyl hydroperoxide reductase subunit AhpC